MIEPDDATAEGHEFGLEAGVVCDQHACPTQHFLGRFDHLDSGAFDLGLSPEVEELRKARMSVPYDLPPVTLEPFNGLLYHGKVYVESRPQFGYFSPDGSWWLPVERNGDRTWLRLTPETGVPRVQLWASDSDGNITITPGPSVTYFIVRAEEHDDISMLSRETARAVERRYSGG